jgi:hypothetical protein
VLTLSVPARREPAFVLGEADLDNNQLYDAHYTVVEGNSSAVVSKRAEYKYALHPRDAASMAFAVNGVAVHRSRAAVARVLADGPVVSALSSDRFVMDANAVANKDTPPSFIVLTSFNAFALVETEGGFAEKGRKERWEGKDGRKGR